MTNFEDKLIRAEGELMGEDSLGEHPDVDKLPHGPTKELAAGVYREWAKTKILFPSMYETHPDLDQRVTVYLHSVLDSKASLSGFMDFVREAISHVEKGTAMRPEPDLDELERNRAEEDSKQIEEHEDEEGEDYA